MLEERLLALLTEHISMIIARGLLQRGAAAAGIRLNDLSSRHLPALLRELEKGIRLFVPGEHQAALLDRLGALGSASSEPQPIALPIESEGDIGKARAMARGMAIDLGATSFTTQKVVTAVSELARNIVLYAGSGRLDIVSSRNPRTKLKIAAIDRGPGIADLELLFSGRYKSKTGLGRGLRGLRRAADDFKIDTGTQGTRVQVEFVL